MDEASSCHPAPRAVWSFWGRKGARAAPWAWPFLSCLQAWACAYKRSGNLAGWKEECSQGSGAEPKCSRPALWELHQKGKELGTCCLFHAASQHCPQCTSWSCTRLGAMIHAISSRELWFHFPALKMVGATAISSVLRFSAAAGSLYPGMAISSTTLWNGLMDRFRPFTSSENGVVVKNFKNMQF